MRTPRKIPSVVLTMALLSGLLLFSASPTRAVTTGNNGRIAFVSDRDGDNEIYAMRGDGTGLVQLTSNAVNDSDPAYSSNGKKIAFVSDRSGTVELYTMNADGTQQRRITTNSMVESHPSWSPTGQDIVFAGLSGTDSDLWTIVPNGSNPVDITPDPQAFDANPSWGPGGHLIAFDSTNRQGNPGTDIYTIKDFGAITRLTTTGTDTHPNWGPNQTDTVVFESGRDNPLTGPSFFASIGAPVGIAATADKLLVTQSNKTKITAYDGNGNKSTFAILPEKGIEPAIAVSPGLGGFPAGYVYVITNENVYEITPDGSSVELFVNIPELPSGNNTMTFDSVGTFGNQLIVVDRGGPIWTVDASGVATFFTSLGHPVQHQPAVAPMSFAPFGGHLLAGNKDFDVLRAVSPNKVISEVGGWDSPNGAVFIPDTACDFGQTRGTYFIAMRGMNQIMKFPAGDFAGLGGKALVPSEVITDIGLFSSNGSEIEVSQFHGPIGTPEMEDSTFVPCPAGARPAAPAGPAAPNEIYTMLEDGTAQTRLTNNTFDDARPAFAPNGTMIVFQSDRDDPGQPACESSGTCKNEMYVMDPDGSGQTNITANLDANDIAPDWQSISALVTVGDFFYDPVTAKPALGGTVQFDFLGPSDHTATDDSGMGLFDSGVKSSGSFWYFTFSAAGRFPIACTLHPGLMNGLVKVPLKVAPKSGGVDTQFTITWATNPPQAGYVFDVQILRPGSSEFVDWHVGVTQQSRGFIPDAGVGEYQFIARLRNTANGAVSEYAAPESITVS
jgi:Tol biopolymer transport system component